MKKLALLTAFCLSTLAATTSWSKPGSSTNACKTSVTCSARAYSVDGEIALFTYTDETYAAAFNQVVKAAEELFGSGRYALITGEKVPVNIAYLHQIPRATIQTSCLKN